MAKTYEERLSRGWGCGVGGFWYISFLLAS
jgi:hypothetical protein